MTMSPWRFLDQSCSGPGWRCAQATVVSDVLPLAARAAVSRLGTSAGIVTRRYKQSQRYTLIIAHGAKSSLPKHQTWLAQGHADAPNSPFHELSLSETERNAGGAIGRRNYSFLMSPNGKQPVEIIDWGALFEDPSKPLVVDLGCGAGRYILLMAHRNGRRQNYLGVDVHKALLDRANGWAAARSLSDSVHYLQANAVASASVLFGSYPGPIELVSIQYPDPQQRRQRHVVGRELVEALASVLKPGARVYLASDFEDTATYMRNAFELYGAGRFCVDDIHATQLVFPCKPLTTLVKTREPSSVGTLFMREKTRTRDGVRQQGPVSVATAGPNEATSEGEPGDPGQEGRGASSVDEDELLWFQGSWQQAGWLGENPIGVPTEREVYVEKATMGRVYRILLVRSVP